MIKLLSFLLLYIAIWCLIFVIEVRSFQNALIFDTRTEKLKDVNEETKVCPSTCLLACPSVQEDEELIDKYGSVSGIGIYMNRLETTDAKAASQVHIESNVKICQYQYKPVMVQDKATNLYKTGYELFYDVEQVTLKYENYEQLKKILFGDPMDVEAQDSEPDAVLKTNENGNTIFQVPHLSLDKWGYYWVSVLSIRVSEEQRQVSFTKDEINNNHQSFSICEDYSLENHYREIPSQKWIAYRKKLSLPQPDPTDPNVADTNLEETQIMPMSYFHTLSARMATCTYLNVAYVPKSISVERLQAVDLYLYAVYRTWPSQIDIIFGAVGISKEADAKLLAWMKENPGSERLRQFPIPVSAILYRIVEYTADEKIYNAIIIIHAVMKSVSEEERICPPESELQGWSDLGQGRVYQGYENPSGLTYTCPVTSETIQKLKVHYGKDSAGSFNLNAGQREEILRLKQSFLLGQNRGHV